MTDRHSNRQNKFEYKNDRKSDFENGEFRPGKKAQRERSPNRTIRHEKTRVFVSKNSVFSIRVIRISEKGCEGKLIRVSPTVARPSRARTTTRLSHFYVSPDVDTGHGRTEECPAAELVPAGASGTEEVSRCWCRGSPEGSGRFPATPSGSANVGRAQGRGRAAESGQGRRTGLPLWRRAEARENCASAEIRCGRECFTGCQRMIV